MSHRVTEQVEMVRQKAQRTPASRPTAKAARLSQVGLRRAGPAKESGLCLRSGSALVSRLWRLPSSTSFRK